MNLSLEILSIVQEKNSKSVYWEVLLFKNKVETVSKTKMYLTDISD